MAGTESRPSVPLDEWLGSASGGRNEIVLVKRTKTEEGADIYHLKLQNLRPGFVIIRWPNEGDINVSYLYGKQFTRATGWPANFGDRYEDYPILGKRVKLHDTSMGELFGKKGWTIHGFIEKGNLYKLAIGIETVKADESNFEINAWGKRSMNLDHTWDLKNTE